MISGFLTPPLISWKDVHTFGFIRCWLQPLSHFVITNIRKLFLISKHFCKYFFSCGGWIRTTDLKVMSLPSYHCSTPRYNILIIIEMLYILRASYLQLVYSPTIIIFLKERFLILFYKYTELFSEFQIFFYFNSIYSEFL